jgi:hypothetical protein
MLDFTKYGREWHRRGNTARLTRARGAEFFGKKGDPSAPFKHKVDNRSGNVRGPRSILLSLPFQDVQC